MRLKIALASAAFALAACADDPAPMQGGGLAGNTIMIPASRPQLEPGKIFAGNDQAVLKQIRDLIERPDSDTDAVISELETYGLDKLAPPVLFEYGRRLKIKGNAGWRYWYEVASLRAKFDQRACNDASAPQFVTVAMMEINSALEGRDKSNYLEEAGKDDDNRWKALRRVIDSGAGFSSKASAWWICSHGMATMSAAMSGRTLSLNDWWAGQAAVNAARKDAETALDAALKAKGF